jgi:hypothetical protein
MMGKRGTSLQCSKPARLMPTSTGDVSVESESYFMIGSRDLRETYQVRKRLSFAYAG